MTPKQKEKLDQLEDELRVPRGTLPIRGEKDGYVFTEVQGVTVLITSKSYNPRGGYKLPAVRTYSETVTPTSLDAAVRARELFERQSKTSECDTGHFNPVVDTDWRCKGDVKGCPCNSEGMAVRQKRSGVGTGKSAN